MCVQSINMLHYNDVIMTTMASQITSVTVVYSTVYSDADQRKHQSSASLAFVWGFHRDRWIPRTKGQLRGKMFPFDDVIMNFFGWYCYIMKYLGKQLPHEHDIQFNFQWRFPQNHFCPYCEQTISFFSHKQYVRLLHPNNNRSLSFS